MKINALCPLAALLPEALTLFSLMYMYWTDYGYGLSGAFAEVNRYKSVSSNDISAGIPTFL